MLILTRNWGYITLPRPQRRRQVTDHVWDAVRLWTEDVLRIEVTGASFCFGFWVWVQLAQMRRLPLYLPQYNPAGPSARLPAWWMACDGCCLKQKNISSPIQLRTLMSCSVGHSFRFVTDRVHAPARYKFIRFGPMDVTKPYKFIGFGAMDVAKSMNS